MAYDWKVVPACGGGLNLAQHPAFIDDTEWSWGDGFLARDGYAEVLTRYTQVKADGWLSNYRCIGVTPNPYNAGEVLLIMKGTSGGNPCLARMDTAGTVNSVTWDTTGTVPTAGDTGAAVFFEGELIVSWGVGSGNYGLARWTGGATYTPINPTAATRGRMLAAFSSHLVLANTASSQAGARTVKVSDANSITTWDPAISNSADEFTITDARSGITAMVPIGPSALGLYTRDGVYVMQPTGAIPPFTVQYVGGVGAMDIGAGTVSIYPELVQLAGATPYGPMIVAHDGVYLGTQQVGRKIFRGLASTYELAYMPQIEWHPGLGVAIVPGQHEDPADSEPRALYLYDPVTQVWSRQTLPDAGGNWARHAVTIESDASETGHVRVPRHWVVSDSTGGGVVYIQALNTAPTGAFFDTKDFGFGSPPVSSYIERIKVDWEPTTGETTTLEVFAAVRNDLGRQSGAAVRGSPILAGLVGAGEAYGLSFTSLGTLSAGQSELPVNLKGKFVRFRIQRSAGSPRVYGFSIRYAPASDAKVAS